MDPTDVMASYRTRMPTQNPQMEVPSALVSVAADSCCIWDPRQSEVRRSAQFAREAVLESRSGFAYARRYEILHHVRLCTMLTAGNQHWLTALRFSISDPKLNCQFCFLARPAAGFFASSIAPPFQKTDPFP